MMAVPQGWEVKRLGEISKINMGQSPDSDYVNEQREGIAFLQGNAEFGEIHPSEKYWVTEPKKVADAGEILVSVRAPVGEINRADKAYCIGRGLASIKISKLDHEYGFYAFSMAKEQLNRLAQGSTFLAISKDDLDAISVLIPPKNEQQKIAEILSGIDRSIEATQTLIDKEKMIKKGLMADLLNHGIDEQGRIRTSQTHRYIESPLGMIPEGWEIKSLGEISKTYAGGTPDRGIEAYYQGHIPWVKSGEVNQTKIYDTEEKITDEAIKNSSAKLIKKNTILVAMYGATAGQIAHLKIDACSNQAVLAVPVEKDCNYFVFYALSWGMPKLLFQAQGSGQPNLSKQLVDRTLLLMPKLSEQQKIAQILSAQDCKIETEEANLAKLQNLKKGLMADLLSGNVRVK